MPVMIAFAFFSLVELQVLQVPTNIAEATRIGALVFLELWDLTGAIGRRDVQILPRTADAFEYLDVEHPHLTPKTQASF
jgi:hypothetical protein